jgi:hypothetical protein
MSQIEGVFVENKDDAGIITSGALAEMLNEDANLCSLKCNLHADEFTSVAILYTKDTLEFIINECCCQSKKRDIEILVYLIKKSLAPFFHDGKHE